MDYEKINSILKSGGVIAFVTDTVWGLGCLPDNQTAVRKIYNIKRREAVKPLILMSNEFYNFFDYLKQPIRKDAQKIVKKYFPGALTLVLEKSENTPDYITSGLNTVGVRIPKNEVFSKLCENIDGHVLATTSANISGEPPALNYEQALKCMWDKADLVIDEGDEPAKGIASTVVGFGDDGIIIYRQGEVAVNI